METTEDRETRRSANCHTLGELKLAGNKLDFYSVDAIRMRRGKTITHYVLKEWNSKFYWTPMSANTIQ